MQFKYSFSHHPCEFCVAKTHCTDCSRNIENLLIKKGASDVSVSIPDQVMSYTAPEDMEDDLLDFLENVGVLI